MISREVGLGHREGNQDRLDLVDLDERAVVVGFDDIANLDEQAPCPSVDRRADRAVFELEARILEHGPVGPHRRLGGVGGGLRLVVLLVRDVVLGDEVGVAFHVRLCALGRGLVPLEVGLDLGQRRLEGPRVDCQQQVALCDVLAFAKSHLCNLPADLCLDRDCRDGLDVADRGNLDGHLALRDCRDLYRDALPGRSLRGPGASPGENGCDKRRQETREEALRSHGFVSTPFGPRAPTSCASCAMARYHSVRDCTSWARALA